MQEKFSTLHEIFPDKYKMLYKIRKIFPIFPEKICFKKSFLIVFVGLFLWF